jgi:hypothetical protein
MTLGLGGEAQRLRVVSEGTANEGTIKLEVLDGDGKVLSVVRVASGAAWQELALIDVPTNARSLRMSLVSGQAPGILIVPEDTELPLDGRP